jgi:hypothetical protein
MDTITLHEAIKSEAVQYVKSLFQTNFEQERDPEFECVKFLSTIKKTRFFVVIYFIENFARVSIDLYDGFDKLSRCPIHFWIPLSGELKSRKKKIINQAVATLINIDTKPKNWTGYYWEYAIFENFTFNYEPPKS